MQPVAVHVPYTILEPEPGDPATTLAMPVE